MLGLVLVAGLRKTLVVKGFKVSTEFIVYLEWLQEMDYLSIPPIQNTKKGYVRLVPVPVTRSPGSRCFLLFLDTHTVRC